MKVQQTQQINSQTNSTFRGAVDTTLRYLATNQAVGANCVDLTFMVTPRTVNDTVKRGPNAGMETFRREIMGTVNDSCLGLYGSFAGALIAALMKVDKEYNDNTKNNSVKESVFKVNKLMTAPETLDILAEHKAKQITENLTQKEYLKNILKDIKAYNPHLKNADKDGYVSLSDEVINKVAEILDNSVNNKDLHYEQWQNIKTENSREVIMNLITADTGAQSKYVLKSLSDNPESKTELKRLIEDIYVISKTFNTKKVNEAFQEQVKNNKNIRENSFIKTLTKYMKNKSYFGFAIASIIGLSVQPLNMYLTKLKTGSDGFVGVEGRTKDDSNGFKVLKSVSATAFFAMILKTLNCSLKNLRALPKDFMSKMAFKGLWPTISQLKGIYGITIISRVLSARDKDELRETLTKDTLGYLSWLVLGDIVNKTVAGLIETKDTVVLNTLEEKPKGLWKNIKRAFNSTLQTRDEVLIKTLSDNGVEINNVKNDKIIAKTFKEMLKDLKNSDKISNEIKQVTLKRLRTLNMAQGAGYLFSGLVLGLGIPNLNIYITNKLDKKRKEQALQKAKENQNIANA